MNDRRLRHAAENSPGKSDVAVAFRVPGRVPGTTEFGLFARSVLIRLPERLSLSLCLGHGQRNYSSNLFDINTIIYRTLGTQSAVEHIVNVCKQDGPSSC